MGCLYRPTLKSGGAGRIIWCKYYVNGRAVRESTGCEKEQAATRFLKEREGRVAIGMPILPRADRIRYEELAEGLRRYYATTGKRDKVESESRLAHLDTFFTKVRVANITSALIRPVCRGAPAPEAGPGRHRDPGRCERHHQP